MSNQQKYHKSAFIAVHKAVNIFIKGSVLVGIYLAFCGPLYADRILPLCSKVITRSVGYTYNTEKIRYCSNRSIYSTYYGVRRAVVFIHGNSRDAQNYYNIIYGDAQSEGVTGTTTVIVPQFIIKSDRDNNNLPSTYVYWSSGGWKKGSRSSNGGVRRSSYDWIDWIVKKLVDKNPNLDHIVVVGHSAGGQFVQRYAGSSEAENDIQSDNVTMSYGVSAAGSYMWLRSDRPYSTSGCSAYNKYKYGMTDMEDWRYHSGKSKTTIRRNYALRNIYYFVGANDTTTDELDTDCQANTQGLERVERAYNFKSHADLECTETFGRYCLSLPSFTTPVMEIAGAGHGPTRVFNSAEARDVLFYWE